MTATTTVQTVETVALAGSELLALVKEMGNAPKSELVRAAGYVSTRKDGGERLNFTAFYEALLNAKGVDLGPAPRTGKAGRLPSYQARVQFNGNLMVGSAYTSQMGLKPGDTFEIRLSKRQISLVPVDGHGVEAV